jgi:hypothetical protein
MIEELNISSENHGGLACTKETDNSIGTSRSLRGSSEKAVTTISYQ